MRNIVTVTGQIEPDDVGLCQFHEHILISRGRPSEINPDLCIDDTTLSTEELMMFKRSGGNTIIDAQPGGCGRMPEELRSISLASGVNIICSTGFHKMCFYPEGHWIFTKDVDAITDFFIRELTEGTDPDCDFSISGKISGVRAGIIKTAVEAGKLTPQYEKLFDAAANASIQADRLIMVHTDKGSHPLELIEFLMDKGISPDNIVVCHMDRTSDEDTMDEILKLGVYLEFDTIGRFKYHSDDDELRIISNRLEKGFEDQLLWSLDTTASRLKAYSPDSEIGLDYIIRVFIPRLRAAGISDDIINKFSRKNPIRALVAKSVYEQNIVKEKILNYR